MLEFVDVKCVIIVDASKNPLQKYEAMFFIEFKPKKLEFPDDFFICRSIYNIADLEEFLQLKKEVFYGDENFLHLDEEALEEYLKKLPAPFNDEDCKVNLTWTAKDVQYTDASSALLKVRKTKYSFLELTSKTVGVLKIIARVKEAAAASKKEDIIQNILEKEGIISKQASLFDFQEVKK